MGLWEEQQLSSFSSKGLELGNESPIFKWEWFSEPLDCPPNEGCNPEPMRGTLALLGRGGSQFYYKDSGEKEGRQMFSLLNMKPKIMAPMLKGRTM